MSSKTTGAGPEGPEVNGPEERDRGAPSQPPRKPGRWMRIVLFISLALNLAVVGLVIGFLINAPKGGPPPRLERTGGLLSIAMTDHQRREVGQIVFQDMKNHRRTRDEMRAEFATIMTQLRARPFDRDALAQTMDRQLQEAIRRQTSGQEILIDYIAEMSPQERAAYADRLEEKLRRPPRPRDEHKSPEREAPGAPSGQ